MTLQTFAEARSVETDPYRDSYYSGDINRADWLGQSVFTLITYAPNIGDYVDQANYEFVVRELEERDPEGVYWQTAWIASWASPFSRVEIHPYGIDGGQPFGDEVVRFAEDALSQLAVYPSLDDDRVSELESEWAPRLNSSLTGD